ncbi:MAG: hypothetical protein ACE5SW_00540 [Nitrososphaeraceae archaeon]
MSRRSAIFLFWLFGFGIGFGGYLAFPTITRWFETIAPHFLEESMLGALIAGLVGSILSTVTIITWANRRS